MIPWGLFWQIIILITVAFVMGIVIYAAVQVQKDKNRD